MKRKYLVLTVSGLGNGVDWLGEWDTKAKAQAHLDEHMADNKDTESGWVVETVGRNYSNT